MAKTVRVQSAAHFQTLLSSSKALLVDCKFPNPLVIGPATHLRLQSTQIGISQPRDSLAAEFH